MDYAMNMRQLAAAILITASTISAHSASAADFFVRQTQPAYEISPCGDSRMLKRIAHRFDHQVRNVPGLPLVGIVDFQRIREHRYLPAGEERPIARHYCNAAALLTNGEGRTIWYLIEEGQGFAGIGDNVEFCVSGF